MKKSIMVLLAASSLLLSACANSGLAPSVSAPTSTQTAVKTVLNSTIKVLPTNVQTKIKTVQDATKAVCRFVPTASTVVSLVNNSKTTMTVEKIAQTICNVVGHKHKRFGVERFGSTVITSYNGIVITGSFER